MDQLLTPSDYAEFFDLQRVFITALLLIGDIDRTEAIVVSAINNLDFETATRHALLERVVRDAVATSPANAGFAPTSITLAPQLRKVIDLPGSMRHCFVLRILVRLDRQQCADSLRIEGDVIDELAIEAAYRLVCQFDSRRQKSAVE